MAAGEGQTAHPFFEADAAVPGSLDDLLLSYSRLLKHLRFVPKVVFLKPIEIPPANKTARERERE